MRTLMIAAAAAFAASATPGLAQVNNQGGLVNVDVSHVLENVTIKDVLSHNNVQANVLQSVAANVQVPIGLAANVCGTTVALLSAAGSGGACTAENKNMTNGTARALANSILRATQNAPAQ